MGNVSSESLDDIKQKIRSLPAELGSSTELMKGYYQVQSAGITEEKAALDLLTQSSKTAKEAHIEQGEVVKGLAAVMGAYKDELKTTSDAADLLYTVEKKGITNIQELIPLVGPLANMAKSLGINVNELGASMAQITKSGAGTSVTLNQLQALMGNLIKPSDELQKIMAKYGGVQAAIKELGFAGVLQMIMEKTQGNTEAVGKLFESKEAILGLLQIAKGSFSEYGATLDEMTRKTGASTDAWNRYKDTLPAIWETFKTNIGKQVMIIGESLAPSIKIVLQGLSDWVEKNRSLLSVNIAERIAGWTVGIKDLASKIDEIITKAKDIITITAKVGKEVLTFYLISKTTAGLEALITFYTTLKVATTALTVKQLALNAAVRANLIGLAAYGGYKIGKWLAESSIPLIGNGQREAERLAEEARQEDIATKIKIQEKLNERSAAGLAVTDEDVANNEANLGQIVTDTANAAQQIGGLAGQASNAQIEKSIEAAEAEKQTLSGLLSEYKSFYASLQSEIQKQANLEKQHITELNALYRQKLDIQRSTEGMIRGLREAGMSEEQKYYSQRQALEDQYKYAMQFSGQDQIKALEDYKQAVASFAQSYSSGLTQTSTRLGEETKSIIVNGQTIINDAITMIQEASDEQGEILAALQAEKEEQIRIDQAWGEELRQTAADAASEMEHLQSTIAGISEEIESMQKQIEIDANDQVSPVVRQIQNTLAQLRDKTITITTVHRDVYSSSYGGGESGSSDVDGSYAEGTDYVPKTGIYILHKGEAVLPTDEAEGIRKATVGGAATVVSGNDREYVSAKDFQKVTRETIIREITASSKPAEIAKAPVKIEFGDININVPASAAPQTPQDWRRIVREQVTVEFEKAGVRLARQVGRA
jgi:TP901 family phage tail tape measure protein